MELFINGKDDAALGCSVKLCQDDACQRNDFTKILCLADSILPCRCIKDKKRLMRSIRNDLLDDTADLCQFFHQVDLCLKAAGRIYQDYICASCLSGRDSIKSNGRRICAFRMLDNVVLPTPLTPTTRMTSG